jgi:hypothetical protein
MPGSGGHAAQPQAVGAAPGSGAEIAEPAERHARGWTMVAVILAAMVIGSLTVLLVMKSGSTVTATDASLARTPPPEQVDASISPIAPIVTPIDAEAAPAAVADAQPAQADAPASPDEPARSPLELAMDERRFADAVAICSKKLTAETAAMCTLAACHARTEVKVRQWFARTASGERSRLIGLCRSLGIDPVVRRPTTKPETADEKCEKNPMACQH